MVKKRSPDTLSSVSDSVSGLRLPPEALDPNAFAASVNASAQQIWLAGLGAFSQAQAERGKAFEALVQDGLALQRQTQTAAEVQIAQATDQLSTMAASLSAQASAMVPLTVAPVDRFESIFEARVAKALAKLGVPTGDEMARLLARVDALTPASKKPKA